MNGTTLFVADLKNTMSRLEPDKSSLMKTNKELFSSLSWRTTSGIGSRTSC